MSGGSQAVLAGLYATALFALARDARTIDKVESSLAAISAALSESPDFKALTTSPLVSRADAGKAVAAAAKAMKLDGTTANFLGVLAANRRLAQLPAIIRAFRALAAQHRGETTAEAPSATPLSGDRKSVVSGKGWSVRVNPGGRRIIYKTTKKTN